MQQLAPHDTVGSIRPAEATLQGVGRAFSMLELLAHEPLTASQIARRLGLKWATTHRTLASLTSMGYVEHHGDSGEYSLGVRTYELGSAYLVTLPLHKVARPYLHAVARSAGVVAQITKRTEHSSVVLSAHEPRSDHVPETTVGCNFPLHCGSKGRVLLAYSDEWFVEQYLSRPLPQLTPLTVTDADVLRTELEHVRAVGYAVTDRDTRLFSSSVAAPVFDARGDLLAAVTLITSPEHLRGSRARLVDLVQRTAHGISKAARTARLAPGWDPLAPV